MKGKIRKGIATLLVLALCLNTINFSAFATESAEAVVNEISRENAQSKWDGVTTESVYQEENYKITFTLASYWEGGYNANVKIENIGDSIIENWYVGFDLANVITNIWNAEIYGSGAGNYVIKNATWNQDIPVGGNIQFGFSSNENFTGFPDRFDIINSNRERNKEEYSVEYTVSNDWGTGFNGTISITNNTEIAIEDWTIEFDFDREITSVWNGRIESNEAKHYVITNDGHNSVIDAGQTVSFGFSGKDGKENDMPYSYHFYSNQLHNFDEEDETETKEELQKADSENDGVEDYIEEYFGTDSSKADTDEDGLSDSAEIYELMLDPICTDTDGDGIQDGDEDTDVDGLTNLEELKLGTDFTNKDTDSDSINDGDEGFIYGTNPLLFDTDGDGVSDGKEIELGTNLLVAEESFNVSMECEEEDAVQVSVDINLTGEQVDTLNVEKVDDEFLFPETMPGYIGSAYDFTVDGEFEEATLKSC